MYKAIIGTLIFAVMCIEVQIYLVALSIHKDYVMPPKEQSPRGLQRVCYNNMAYILWTDGSVANIQVWDHITWSMVPVKCGL